MMTVTILFNNGVEKKFVDVENHKASEDGFSFDYHVLNQTKEKHHAAIRKDAIMMMDTYIRED